MTVQFLCMCRLSLGGGGHLLLAALPCLLSAVFSSCVGPLASIPGAVQPGLVSGGVFVRLFVFLHGLYIFSEGFVAPLHACLCLASFLCCWLPTVLVYLACGDLLPFHALVLTGVFSGYYVLHGCGVCLLIFLGR